MPRVRIPRPAGRHRDTPRDRLAQRPAIGRDGGASVRRPVHADLRDPGQRPERRDHRQRDDQGVVVGDFEGTAAGVQGFYIQDPTGDGDPATSDGIFVFTGSREHRERRRARPRHRLRARALRTQTGAGLTAINGANSDTRGPSTNIVNCGTGSVARDRRDPAVRRRRRSPSATRACSSASRSRS